MQRILISDSSDDDNDGLTALTPIRSWQQRLKLKTGHDEMVILGDTEKTIVRPSQEKVAARVALTQSSCRTERLTQYAPPSGAGGPTPFASPGT